MPKRKIIKVIKELNKLIKEQYPDLKGLYLYGSQVKGTAHKDSDIDVVAIFDEVSYEKSFEIGGILSDLMYKYDIYIDFHSYTPETIQRNPYYYNEVVNNGIYYEAA
jgi:predicted nucleotidyltransferase